MQFQNDTIATCVNSYFIENIEDEEVRPIIKWTLNTAKENVLIMKEIFHKENFPVPLGFTKEDVHPDSPRLFSDTFKLMYLRQMSILAMAASSAALGLITRPDVLLFFKRVLEAAVKLQDLTRNLMLKQGTYVRLPHISIPDKVEFVERQQFLAVFFGPIRALTGLKVTHLFMNIQTNSIGKALIMGLAQTSKSNEVKQYLLRGKQIAQKHIDIFSDYLNKEDLPVPMGWDASVGDSTTPIFSDKLIMFHISAMIAAGVGNYGMAMAASPSRDLGIRYASLIPEIALYAEDGANIMIDRGWMEEPPQADDRNQLMKGK
jgi:hypothetical protein